MSARKPADWTTSATLDDFARAMRRSLQPHAERLLAEVRALQPAESGLIATSTPPPGKILRRTLRCRLGIHRWERRWTDTNPFMSWSFRVCASCGKRDR